ncbi:MAG: serine/threonine-protein kinase [Myxococcota bacterium]
MLRVVPQVPEFEVHGGRAETKPCFEGSGGPPRLLPHSAFGTVTEPRSPAPSMAECGGLEEWAAELQGRVLNGRYRIEKVLGFGMTGGVFRGTRLGLSKAVAIKILHEDLRCNPNIRARFEREALTASQLCHPNCVNILDVDEDGELSYFVMPLVEGFELSEILGTPLNVELALSIASQLLEGLHYAHSMRVIHRDVKPENIIVTPGSRKRRLVKLLDFGIAKTRMPHGRRRLTGLGQIFGTPQYMSPEQASGKEVTEASDLYSTGLILYEMLTGEPPYTADDSVLLLSMQIRREVPSLRGRFSDALATVVERLCAKDPQLRYANAGQACGALEAAMMAERNEQPTRLDGDISWRMPWAESEPTTGSITRWTEPSIRMAMSGAESQPFNTPLGSPMVGSIAQVPIRDVAQRERTVVIVAAVCIAVSSWLAMALSIYWIHG